MSETCPRAPTQHQHLSLCVDHKHLVYECFHFAVEYAPKAKDDDLFKVLEGFYQRLQEKVSAESTDSQKLQILNAFFFKTEGFSCQQKDQGSQPLLLTHILNKKSGSPHLLKLLYLSLAGTLGLQMQCVCDPSHHLLKLFIDGRSHILDFSRNGTFLEPYELVDAVNQGVDFTVFDSGEKTLVRYLYNIKTLAKETHQLQQVVLANRYLMRWQPFNLRHIRERAQIAYKIGDYRKAAEDIRSYFLYKSPEIKSFRLNQLYRLSLLKK